MQSLPAALLAILIPLSVVSQDAAVPKPKRPRKINRRTPAWAVLGVSLTVTLAAWQFVRFKAEASLQTRFRTRVELIEQTLLARIGSYEIAMRAAAALVAASPKLTREEWQQFVRSLQIQQAFPGLTQLAFVAGPAPSDATAPARAAQSRTAESRPLMLRFVATAGPGPFPPQIDLAAVPEYRQAADRAGESGRTTLSEYSPRTAGRGADLPALFLPVYATANPAAPAPADRTPPIGWLVAWFEPDVLLGILRYPLAHNIDLEVFAAEDTRDSYLLYDTDETLRAAAGNGAFVKCETLTLEIFGRAWTLAIGAKPEFFGSEADAATLVFAAGLVASLVLFVVTDSLAFSRMRALGAAKLITERLRQNEAHSHAVIENAPVGIVTVAANRSIETVNSAAARMFGYRGHELASCMFEELLAEPARFRAKGFEEFSAFRKETGRRADGTAFPIEVSAWPMQLGGQTMYTAIVVDVTERLQAAEALRAERDFSAAVLNLAPALVVVVDPEGHIVSFNRACEEATGYHFEQVRGKGLLELLVPAEERAAVQRAVAELHSGLCPNHHENHWLTKDGRQRLISWSNTALRDARGSVKFLISCGVDVTEQRGAEKEHDRYVIELERAQHTTERQAEMLARQTDELAAARDAALDSARLKSQFLANMSHEIRTPMSGVLGMTHLLANTDLSEEQRDYVVTIRSSGEALLTILNDILDFSKIEAGKLRFETLDFNLGKTVEGTVRLLRPQTSAKGIELKSSIAAGVPAWVRGDPGRLRQILFNLIGNAIKFTDRGQVEVSVAVEDATSESVGLRFAVRDTGMGINPEARKNLFHPFVQADGSTSRKHGGTGLGLAISQQLANRMGGEIGCESVPGEGSLFWFTVKLGKPDADSIPRLKELKALVIADQDADRDSLMRNLDSWEMEALSAASFSEALETLLRPAAGGRSFATVVVQTSAGAQFAQFAEEVRADPRIAGIEILAWGQEQLEPHLARLRELRVKVGGHGAVAVSDLFNALVDMASGRAGARPYGARGDDASAIGQSPPPAAPSVGRKVLVVEDNLVNQKVAVRMLQNLGCDAEAVSNGLEALEALDRASYDLILMDCQMPEMDGYQATAEIRRRENGRARPPIIALTAHAMQGDRERCLEAGMDDYLSKPINPQALTSALRRWGLLWDKDDTDTVEAGKRTP
jgi:PAS domain S-box-containing protein